MDVLGENAPTVGSVRVKETAEEKLVLKFLEEPGLVVSLGPPTHCVCVCQRLCLRFPELCLPVFVFADRQTLCVYRRPFC